jgi:hypothetical protein
MFLGRRKQASNPEAAPYYLDILEALRQPGCAFCRLSEASANRYLDAILWEMVNDLEVRAELNAARGYCSDHVRLLARAGAALGVAILSKDVLRTLLDVLAANPIEDADDSVVQGLLRAADRNAPSKVAAKVVAALEPQRPCPVCRHQQDRERELTTTLLAYLDGLGALAQAYHSSDGLCLPHFRQVLSQASSAKDARALIRVQQAVWQRLHGQLGEFIRKSDVRFREEGFGPEKDSWRRAIEAFGGRDRGS